MRVRYLFEYPDGKKRALIRDCTYISIAHETAMGVPSLHLYEGNSLVRILGINDVLEIMEHK